MVEPDSVLGKFILKEFKCAAVRAFDACDAGNKLSPELDQEGVFASLLEEYENRLHGDYKPLEGKEEDFAKAKLEILRELHLVFTESYKAGRKLRDHLLCVDSEKLRDDVAAVFNTDTVGEYPNMPGFYTYIKKTLPSHEGPVVNFILPLIDPESLEDPDDEDDSSDEEEDSSNDDKSLDSNESSSEENENSESEEKPKRKKRAPTPASSEEDEPPKKTIKYE